MTKNLHKRFATLPLISLTLLFLLSNQLFAQAVDQEAAKKEGRIVVYGTTIPNVMRQAVRAGVSRWRERTAQAPHAP